ncbi:MAG TPA: DUF4396 domain-containing protein [Verrucomicrobiae bacterium]|nr:DUF4396 domain-containing protein [Verrucomicrobiae bacterium]
MHVPNWLEILALVSLCAAGVSFLVIVIDLISGHAQHMWIMNVVWPVTALYLGPLALVTYFRWGRLSTQRSVMQAQEQGRENPGKRKPFWQQCAVGVTHCGSGCTLGDIAAEWLLFAFPVVLFGHKIFGNWVIDYVLAFLLGIAFQYFTIKPMRDLPGRKALWAAVKADTLSLTAWQLGMYGWMALTTFVIFGHELAKTSPVFWFMMQVAMWLGFATSYPVNWWLLRSGIKEAM